MRLMHLEQSTATETQLYNGSVGTLHWTQSETLSKDMREEDGWDLHNDFAGPTASNGVKRAPLASL
jgi:hypothetical protein